MGWVGWAILAISPDGLIWARFRPWTAAAIWVPTELLLEDYFPRAVPRKPRDLPRAVGYEGDICNNVGQVLRVLVQDGPSHLSTDN